MPQELPLPRRVCRIDMPARRDRMNAMMRGLVLAAFCLLTLAACGASQPAYQDMQNALTNPSGGGGSDGGGGSGGGGM
jgi:hypothetical protein